MTVALKKKRATIRDVGRRALVSHQTVSRVINGEHSIAPATRARVERAIAELGFHPNHVARSLARRKTYTVGVVMGDVASPFFPDVVRGAEDVLAPLGYSLFLASSRRDPDVERRNVEHLLDRSADGLILGAPRNRPGELAALGRQAGVPMVFLNRDVRGRLVASVWVDWPSATSEVVEYLAGLGHRRIALVVPSRDEAPFASREDWYERALGRSDLTPPPSLIVRERISIEGGHRAALRLLSLEAPPTAAICHNDTMAIGVLQACAERGVRVPRDLSVVGWDDVPYASLVTPSLTTVHVPRHELGRAAAATLMHLMDGRPARGPGPLPLQLIRRQSCRRIGRSPERT